MTRVSTSSTAGLKNTPHLPWTSLHTTINTSSNPSLPTPAIQISENEVRQVFWKQKRKKKHLAQTVLHQSVWNPVLTSWPPSSQRSSTDHWNCAKSPHASNAPPSSPSQRNPKLQDWTKITGPKWLQACGSDPPGHSLDPLQFAYRANRSVDDAVNMGLHYVLQHLDRPGTYVRILCVDFSSAFNTIIPNRLLPKLTQFSMPTSICQWITSFLTDRQQLERLLRAAFSLPHLFSLYTNDCTSKDPSVKLLKFADDATLIGLIQDGDKSAYRQEEVKELAVWSSLNNLELNMLKTVEMIVDFRRNPPALPHSPSWTAPWLQWSHSASWALPSPRTWSGTIT